MATEHKQVAKQFCNSPLWREALWAATTFRWHPTGEAPPVMGLLFADWRKGVNLFRTWTDEFGNADEHDDIRVAIIEGNIPGQAPGYAVRISPAQADWNPNRAEQPPLGQVQRMHPLSHMPEMLMEFKREYLRHHEFLLAPVVQRDDNQLWFNANAGIIKRELVLRRASEIAEDEPDAIILRGAPTRDGSSQVPDKI